MRSLEPERESPGCEQGSALPLCYSLYFVATLLLQSQPAIRTVARIGQRDNFLSKCRCIFASFLRRYIRENVQLWCIFMNSDYFPDCWPATGSVVTPLSVRFYHWDLLQAKKIIRWHGMDFYLMQLKQFQCCGHGSNKCYNFPPFHFPTHIILNHFTKTGSPRD